MLLTKKILCLSIGTVVVAISGPLVAHFKNKLAINNKYNSEKYSALDYEFSWDSDDEDGKWNRVPSGRVNNYLSSYFKNAVSKSEKSAKDFVSFWDDMTRARTSKGVGTRFIV